MANMRQAMPSTAALIDDLRSAFGAAAIEPSIRRGMGGEPGWFHASENGQEVGTAWPMDGGVVPVIPQSVVDEVIGQARTDERAKRRK